MLVLCHDIESYSCSMKRYTMTLVLYENGQRCTSLDTVRSKLNVHKTFRRRPGRLMYDQFTSCVQRESGKILPSHIFCLELDSKHL